MKKSPPFPQVRAVPRSLSVLVALVLVACGGGGGTDEPAATLQAPAPGTGAGGGYPIVWNIPVGQLGSITYEYLQQRYDASGVKVGGNDPWQGTTGTSQLNSRVALPSGGYLQFQRSASFPSALSVQQFDAQGAAVAPAMEPLAGGRAPGWGNTGVVLPSGAIVIAVQPVNQSGPGEIWTNLLLPAGS